MFKHTLTPDDADRIVSLVEDILASPQLPYGYRLSELKGFSRIDVANALLINLAQVYKVGTNNPVFRNQITKLVEAMDSSLIHIAMRGIPDEEIANLKNINDNMAIIGLTGKWSLISKPGDIDSNPSIDEERKIFGNLEMPSSIAKYCSELIDSADTEYWRKIYTRIGLEYPVWYFDKPSKKTVKDVIINSTTEKGSKKSYQLPKEVEEDLKGLSPQNQLRYLEKLKEIQLRDRSVNKLEAGHQHEIPTQPIISRESLLKATIEIANQQKLTAYESFCKGRSLFIASNISLEDIENAMTSHEQKSDYLIMAENTFQKSSTSSLSNKKSNIFFKGDWQVNWFYTIAIIIYGIVLYVRLPFLNWDGPAVILPIC